MIEFNRQRLKNELRGDKDKIREFGIRCGMSTYNVHQLLKGKIKNPRWHTVVTIARFIGEDSIDELVQVEEK